MATGAHTDQQVYAYYHNNVAPLLKKSYDATLFNMTKSIYPLLADANELVNFLKTTSEAMRNALSLRLDALKKTTTPMRPL